MIDRKRKQTNLDDRKTRRVANEFHRSHRCRRNKDPRSFRKKNETTDGKKKEAKEEEEEEEEDRVEL